MILKERCFRLLISFLLLFLAWPLPVERALAFDLSMPKRQGMYFGLDPGFVMATPDRTDTLPKLLRANLRGGYCVNAWFHAGLDFTLDFIVDRDQTANFEAAKILQPMLTFFPIAGLNFHGGGGFDAFSFDRFAITAGAGYEFPINNFGGVGLGFVFSQIWNTGSTRGHWQLYSIALQFSAYDVLRDWDTWEDG